MIVSLFSLIISCITQQNVRITNNISILNRRTTTQTATTSTTSYNSTIIKKVNTTYSYTIPYLKEILSLDLPDPNNLMNSISYNPRMPFRPIGVPSTDQNYFDDDTTKALQSAVKASQNSQIALSAAAKAVVTCTAYGAIDCEELMKTKNQTDVYLKIASNSLQNAKLSANTVVLTSNSNFSFTGPLDRRTYMMKDWAFQIAQAAVNQAEIAAQVTATASAQCEIIVDIKCNRCKNG
jgi:hypothetical protein